MKREEGDAEDAIARVLPRARGGGGHGKTHPLPEDGTEERIVSGSRHRRGFGQPDLRGTCEDVQGRAFQHEGTQMLARVRPAATHEAG